MKTKIFIFAFTLFIVTGVLLSIALLGPSILSRTEGIQANVNTNPAPETGNAIVRENQKQGAPGWVIPINKESKTQIQAYADATSVAPGQKINFYVSTQQDGTKYQIDIYRLGWYQGVGARKMIPTVTKQTGHAQGYYDANASTLIGCNTCLIDKQKQLGLLEARWTNPYTLTIGADWTSGIYLAKFTDANEWQTYTPFDVLPATQNSAYIAVTPDTTYAARNQWGGAGFTFASADIRTQFQGMPSLFAPNAGVARVSFNKPYSQGVGAADTLLYVAQMVRWMERNGYDVSYISDVDLHEHGLVWLQTHKAYISLGDDEYWTPQMYDAVQQARDKGIGLVFMGANAIAWHMRFEPSSAGKADRTLVCYRVQSVNGPADLQRDPLYTLPTAFVPRPDNAAVTSMWSDPGRANLLFTESDGLSYRPEQALVGSMHADLTTLYRPGYPWQISKTADANSVLLKGTGLTPGQPYGCGLVGPEWNTVNQKFPSPVQNLHVLGESPAYSDVTHITAASNTTYYFAQSGALVFATGSFFFSSALDSYRSPDMLQNMSPTKYCGQRNTNSSIPDLRGVPGMSTPDTIIPGMQMLMKNVMDQLTSRHTPNS